jgi:hypothetical protein
MKCRRKYIQTVYLSVSKEIIIIFEIMYIYNTMYCVSTSSISFETLTRRRRRRRSSVTDFDLYTYNDECNKYILAAVGVSSRLCL